MEVKLRMKHPARIWAIPGLMLLVAGGFFGTAAETRPTPAVAVDPFAVGEKLVYEVSWADFLVAGELTLETRQGRSTAGSNTVQVSATAESVGLVSLMSMKVKDVYSSTMATAELRPIHAEKTSRHGKKQRNGTIAFDWDRGIATLSTGRSIAIEPGTYDIAGLLWAIRGMDLSKKASFNVIEDDKVYPITVEPEGKEKITTRAGTFDTVRLATKTTSAGRAGTIYNLRLYVTNDSRRMPVMITAEPSWGKVKVSLTSVSGAKPLGRK